MRVMTFYDLENFKKGLEKINKERYEKEGKYRLFNYYKFR